VSVEAVVSDDDTDSSPDESSSDNASEDDIVSLVAFVFLLLSFSYVVEASIIFI
jgi:hypothetical protein